MPAPFKIKNFRLHFPEFNKCNDAIINQYREIAEIFLAPEEDASIDHGILEFGLQLFVAHCLSLVTGQIVGNDNGQTCVNSCITIDKQPEEYTLLTFTTIFEYWANTTPYGQNLLNLLEIENTDSSCFGCTNGRSTFKKPADVSE